MVVEPHRLIREVGSDLHEERRSVSFPILPRTSSHLNRSRGKILELLAPLKVGD